jgi:hypothetical protein
MKMSEGKILLINKDEVIEVLKSNTDLSSKEIDNKLIMMVYRYYDRLTVKQLQWLSEKLKYIIRHNDLYKDYKKTGDIFFEQENNDNESLSRECVK